jgi:isoleucyl-tRNA synthetase
MFKKVDQRKKYSEMEGEVITFWKENRIFEKSVKNRSKADSYVFYDGPPFITGVPHYGTLLSSIVKDVVPRYWTMKGKHVERRWGWDCHGLPAENLVEKILGVRDKREVAKIGLEKYIETCRTEMSVGGEAWESMVERIGRWVEFKNAYKTMDKDYMESVWWAFKELYQKGKIYEGEKVLLYCTRCATPISKAEVAMDNSYKVINDPSLYVKFNLEGTKDTYFLAWTTTPWTLTANMALAVGEKIKYVKIKYTKDHKVEYYILAKKAYETKKDFLFGDEGTASDKKTPTSFEIVEEFNGSELVGKNYKPLFGDPIAYAHRVVGAEFVTTEDGTGIVHIAPAFGEDDYILSEIEKIPVLKPVNEHGFYTEGKWKNQNIWEANKEIAKNLLAENKALKIEYIQHEYPHCHRCATKLMYRAHPSWFMDINGQKKDMLESGKNINWFPSHFGKKRFRNTVESAPDWNLSRDRFWATALPVWRGPKKDGTVITKVIGSYAELKELSGVELDDYHLPYIDDVTFEIDGVKMKRVEKVLDCWFESGSMPFAQFHYPFENKAKFEDNFPADFISEYVGQIRAWFYYMHAISVGLFKKESFKNVIVTGTISGSDGKKMSKSLGNYTDPGILLEKFSADALRYLLISSPLLNGEDFSLNDKDVSDVQRKLSTLWNSYSFFVTYANIDGWSPSKLNYQGSENLLDKWIVSKLNILIGSVDKYMQAYDLPNATNPIMEFIDDLSNWYIRRSRKRFWKSENDNDKNNAYSTLYYVLVHLSRLMAPFTPFVSEEIYKNLTNKESVHLTDFPAADSSLIDKTIVKKMADTRAIIKEALQQRATNKIKVRQPLPDLTLTNNEIGEDYQEIIKEEVNVKKIIFKTNKNSEIKLNTKISKELKLEGYAREIIRIIQEERKKAGYEIGDRIIIGYAGLEEVFSEFGNMIKKETLAKSLDSTLFTDGDIQAKFEIDNQTLELTIKR